MFTKKYFVVVLVASITLMGCQSNPSKTESSDRSSAQTGAIIGGILGAIVGSRKGGKEAAKYAAIGAAIGGAVGYFGPKLLRSLSPQDQNTHLSATSRTLKELPDGEGYQWNNPDTMASGEVMALNSYTDQAGTQCRTVKETIVFNGQKESVDTQYCWDPELKDYKAVG